MIIRTIVMKTKMKMLVWGETVWILRILYLRKLSRQIFLFNLFCILNSNCVFCYKYFTVPLVFLLQFPPTSFKVLYLIWVKWINYQQAWKHYPPTYDKTWGRARAAGSNFFSISMRKLWIYTFNNLYAIKQKCKEK